MNSFDNFPDCVFLIDKPKEWTSFDVVNKIRRLVKIKKVGHAGTLDPAATGLLIVCTGKMTKQIDRFQNQRKVYTGTMKLGFTTPSYDAETEPVASGSVDGITLSNIDSAKKNLTGDIKQIPPMYSALKKAGKKLYELARKGIEIEREARPVTIYNFQIDKTNDNSILTFYVECSKGTYIRSLVHDLGQLLGCGAYLLDLRREKNGDFSVSDSWTISQFTEKIKNYFLTTKEMG